MVVDLHRHRIHVVVIESASSLLNLHCGCQIRLIVIETASWLSNPHRHHHQIHIMVVDPRRRQIHVVVVESTSWLLNPPHHRRNRILVVESTSSSSNPHHGWRVLRTSQKLV